MRTLARLPLLRCAPRRSAARAPAAAPRPASRRSSSAPKTAPKPPDCDDAPFDLCAKAEAHGIKLTRAELKMIREDAHGDRAGCLTDGEWNALVQVRLVRPLLPILLLLMLLILLNNTTTNTY